MLTWHLLMKMLLGAAMGILLAVHGIWLDDPVHWIAMIGMLVAGMLGHDEGMRDARLQQLGVSVDNSRNH